MLHATSTARSPTRFPRPSPGSGGSSDRSPWDSVTPEKSRTHGKVDGAVLVLMDIDALKQIEDKLREGEQAAARLAAIVTSSDDAIISKDLRGIIQTWNTGAERLFGYAAAEAIGKSVALLIPADRADEEPGILERIGRGESVDHYETVRRRKDGGLVDIALTVSPIRDADGQIIGAAKIARDITERKQIQEALREYTTELSAGSGRKNEFLAMLGHELRNPLSAISSGLDLMGKLPDDNVRREELRAMMARQIKRIATLLDQLMDITRVISGKVELSKGRVDLAYVVRAAAEAVSPIMASQKHTLTLILPPEESAFVMGDVVRLTEVVENLLTNAAKYTNEGGQIVLSLEIPSEEKVRIAVRDNGTGMSTDLIPHVFEMFTQAPRTLERSKGGLGLGLPLVQRLVKMHGGEVTVTSPGLGQGSEFVVTLPRVPERPSSERLESDVLSRPAFEPDPIGHRRILVVDDEEDTRETFTALLREDGHEILAVKDGRAALEAVRAFDPEVVLLDLGLPEMDGYEIARRLREEYRDKKILLIAVTGYQSDDARLKQAGFDGHLIKPADPQKLSALIAQWSQRGRAP